MLRFALALTLVLRVPAFADDGGTTAAAVEARPSVAEPEIPVSEPPELLRDGELSLGWSLVQTFIVLGMVVALAWLTLNVGLRRLMGLGPAGRQGIVRVIERVPLDQKRALFVIQAGDEVLLLGASEASLEVLTKLDRSVVPAAAPSSVLASPMLQKLLGKKEAPSPKEPPAP